MSTVTVTRTTQLRISEVFTESELPSLSASRRTIVHSDFDVTEQLDDSSTPAVTAAHSALYIGNQTLNLAALVNDIGANSNFDTLEVQAILVNNLSASATLVLNDSAGGNTYALNAGADVTILPGCTWEMTFNNELGADVAAAGARELPFAITAGHTYEVSIVAG